jgi:hypothetical protein
MKTVSKFILTFAMLTNYSLAKDYQIYSIMQDVPMGYENEIIRKNYYINMGTGQGLSKGTVLDVYRSLSLQNPYDGSKRVNYKVKVGTLEVIHSEGEAAIAYKKKFNNDEAKDPYAEIYDFMIGDTVKVSVKN